MSKERELLKQVVENFAYVQDMHLIVAIQKLLNQPEQEPVAWGYKKRVTYKPEGSAEEEIIPLYTLPPKREPLSSIKILELTSKHEYAIDLIRAIEKAHGITGVDDES